MKKLAVCCLSLVAMGAYAHTAKFICDWKTRSWSKLAGSSSWSIRTT